jgi:histidine triad (HIT) family protein
MSDSSCIFCRIVAREVPAEILRESDAVLAFRDIAPRAPTHIVLIPKEHVESVAELEDRHAGALADLMQAATHLARTEGIDRSGWRLITNVGPDAGQEVFHICWGVARSVRSWPPPERRGGAG